MRQKKQLAEIENEIKKHPLPPPTGQ